MAESECAEVFADFVASFEDSRVAGKTFVRGNTINPETKGTTNCKYQFLLAKYFLVSQIFHPVNNGIVGCLRHPGASTIGSQLLDGAWSHGWQMLAT